jgi:hypothetical protein
MSEAADELDDDAGDDADDITAPEVIEDPDSFVQSQRLKDIFGARRDVRKQRLKMKTLAIDADTQADVRAAKRGYRAAVEGYLQELRPVFMDDKQGQDVWFGLDFGTLKIELPVQRETVGLNREQLIYRETKPNGKTKKHKVGTQPEPKEIDLHGMNYLFELPEPIAVEFEWTNISSGSWASSTHSKSITKRHDIGFDRLDQIVNEANHRLQERGFDLELGEDNAVAEADYSDIV